MKDHKKSLDDKLLLIAQININVHVKCVFSQGWHNTKRTEEKRNKVLN